MMLTSYILIASILLQFLAVYYALRLINITGKSLAWGLIAAAIALMALRRTVSLVQMFAVEAPVQPDLAVELIALAISALMAFGIERIVSQRSASARLRESEARYRLTFENSPVSIWEEDLSGVKTFFDRLRREGVTDIEAYFEQHPETVRQCAERVKIVDVNRVAVAFHGAGSKNELLAEPLNRFIHESSDGFRHELVCLWRGDTETSRDGVVKTLNGEPRNVTVNFAVCPGYEKTFAKVFVSLVDITERKQAEQERLVHADFLANMDRINRAIQGAGDLDTMMHDVLEEALDIFDCDRAFLMYPCDPTAAFLISPMECARSQFPGAGTLNEEIPVDTEMARTLRLLLNAPGTLAFGPGTGRPVPKRISDQFSVRSCLSVALYPKVGKAWQFGLHQCVRVRDWTKTEERLMQAIGRRLSDALTGLLVQEDMRESERRLIEAQRLAHIGNWELDLLTNSLNWSDEIFRIFEIDKERFGASYEAFLEAIHPEDRDLVNNAYTESLENKRPYEIIHRLLMKDGRIKYVNERCETFYDAGGKALRSVGTVQDISEQKLREDELARYRDHLEEEVRQRTEQLRLARDAAEAASKAKSVFLANMSHELRTPLNAILGFSQLMRRDAGFSAGQYKNLEIINRSGEHLLKLINDVLEIAKIEAGKLQLENATFDLQGLVREVTDMMRLRAQQEGLWLELDQSSEFPRYIKGDEARMRQILVNLVSNAVKFTEEGGVTIRLGVKTNAHNHLIVEVEDTGPGISEVDQKQLFKPFVQLTEGKTQVGTGLGLSIVEQFVKLMGGEVSVKSALGKGSLFRAELPLEAAEEEIVVQLAAESSDRTGALVSEPPGYRILIAEDQFDNQQLLLELMNEIGVETRIADNGEEAVRLFESWKPHLIWMDWLMPVMDGKEAARRIRQLPGGDEVKIVAVTASAFKEEHDELLAAGMDGFVRKPYRFREIYDSLAEQLELRYLYRDHAIPGQVVPAADKPTGDRPGRSHN